MPITPGIELRKDAILARITQEQIFERYLGIDVNTEIFNCNPLRPDRRPGCRFYYNAIGTLYFNDFGKYHWDCFAVVQYKYDCSFIDALRRIVRDFSLQDSNTIERNTYSMPVKERQEIAVSVRAWEKSDIQFWKQGNITVEDLAKFDVYPIKSYWVNKEYYKCWKTDPTYCYYFGHGLYKLYFPLRNEMRFFQNISAIDDDLTQGWNKLPPTGDILFITKSYKDVISMSTFGLTADSVLAENHLVRPEKMANYKERFPYIFTLFDPDAVGRRLAIKYYKVYGVPYLMFPRGWRKDFFANVSAYGPDMMRKLIQEWKKLSIGLE